MQVISFIMTDNQFLSSNRSLILSGLKQNTSTETLIVQQRMQVRGGMETVVRGQTSMENTTLAALNGIKVFSGINGKVMNA